MYELKSETGLHMIKKLKLTGQHYKNKIRRIEIN